MRKKTHLIFLIRPSSIEMTLSCDGSFLLYWLRLATSSSARLGPPALPNCAKEPYASDFYVEHAVSRTNERPRIEQSGRAAIPQGQRTTNDKAESFS